MKKQNTDFEATQDFFGEFKYYTIQNSLKKTRQVRFSDVIDFALNRYCLQPWDRSAPALRYAIVFFEKNLCYWIVLLLVNMRYLYEYGDSNAWCKFIDINVYKITEDHSVAANQTKNDHI